MPVVKYQPKPVYWDSNNQIVINRQEAEKHRTKYRLNLPPYIFRFDSTHEFNVYLELVRMYGVDRVVRQYPLKVFPPGHCYPKGKTWKVDFAINSAKPPFHFTHYVEAKGLLMRESRLMLASLECHNREAFNRFYLVFSNGLPLENDLVKALHNSDCKEMLLTLPELKKLKTLP